MGQFDFSFIFYGQLFLFIPKFVLKTLGKGYIFGTPVPFVKHQKILISKKASKQVFPDSTIPLNMKLNFVLLKIYVQKLNFKINLPELKDQLNYLPQFYTMSFINHTSQNLFLKYFRP